jgi:hypothetical protein
MIHHISIYARNPLRVANVLAEILAGKVYKFLIPGSYLEFFPAEFTSQYLHTMQTDAIAQILGQPIQPIPL